ncbi:hypothetical protein [Ktedonobacter racemifer]|uniref:hypothetical protein n=1 Tax=Ktedonobacter racemifer TaxID=363277 RepID=UPI00059132D8|nr:hypothetical protein [Ktedonobacter racemifer]
MRQSFYRPVQRRVYNDLQTEQRFPERGEGALAPLSLTTLLSNSLLMVLSLFAQPPSMLKAYHRTFEVFLTAISQIKVQGARSPEHLEQVTGR